MACGRASLNHQDGKSIGRALTVWTQNVKRQHKDYDINRMHKEILLDYDNAESQAFMDTFGEPISNLLRGCSVHFIHSAMRVAKLVNSSTISPGYRIFMSVVKRIPDEPSKDAFEVLCGAKRLKYFQGISHQIYHQCQLIKWICITGRVWKPGQNCGDIHMYVC